jgi:hypothetical protein
VLCQRQLIDNLDDIARALTGLIFAENRRVLQWFTDVSGCGAGAYYKNAKSRFAKKFLVNNS